MRDSWQEPSQANSFAKRSANRKTLVNLMRVPPKKIARIRQTGIPVPYRHPETSPYFLLLRLWTPFVHTSTNRVPAGCKRRRNPAQSAEVHRVSPYTSKSTNDGQRPYVAVVNALGIWLHRAPARLLPVAETNHPKNDRWKSSAARRTGETE